MDQKYRYNEPRALAAELNVFNDEKEWFELKTKKDISMSDLDVILMRKDPPFNKNISIRPIYSKLQKEKVY